ncbi:hypothetical protein K431DRAFT_273036 [Polychaeton citri CBS 116435]|uniref:STAS domain-containing protein n=1 Tax=Polychaeton citri CBS 116435 TaxID=1314669 RepID=A0A9P4Q3V8_9PEZI|nr:hypothetical protein K431DRAFT_273036 [Polychaeton citri CBS 116435]
MASNDSTGGRPKERDFGPSPRHSARSSRQSSLSLPQGQHAPSVPSGLRHSEMPPESPEERSKWEARMEYVDSGHEEHSQPEASTIGGLGHGVTATDAEALPDARTALLKDQKKYKVNEEHGCGEENCTHGTFSPRPKFNRRGYGSFATMNSEDSEEGLGGRYAGGLGDGVGNSGDNAHGLLGDAVTDSLLGPREGNKMSTTQWLARRHGVKNTRLMYLLYYIPCVNWMKQYRWSFLQGDLIAALTMASFYIPMSLSYASNLGHIPPINGLYSFVFNPIVYALLGTCPQMVVGPEAAGSLLTGQVVREAINAGHHSDLDGHHHAQIAGMVTGIAGAIILAAGLCRLGFLDSVLSRPFLRGFISAIGIVILVDQLIPEMGLETAASHSQAGSHGSSLDKILFLVRHGKEAKKLTCAVSFGAFAIVMLLREVKRRLQPRMRWVAYIPDRFIVVVLSAVFAWKFEWDKQGLDILGDIQAKGTPFKAHLPFDRNNFKHVNDAVSTGFLIALLGFFESSVAAKSLGVGNAKTRTVKRDDGKEVEEADGIKNVTVSANRELVALGVANLIGGIFMALPAFGGYGRSKVNASTGGKTPMSSVFLSIISVICVLFLLPYFYYIPKGVLCAMISVVAYSLIEEAPHDLHFFWTIGGYAELVLMMIIFLTTFFWNLKVGIAVGIGLSLLRLLKHSTRPRIQILGRIPGTIEFENAELLPEDVEFVPHCLIVKIPEPLTFANTGSLKDRLKRLEDHGTAAAHPALPKVRRAEHNQNVIFDVHGVTSLDPAAAQVLLEIVQSYIDRGTRVFFCRIPGKRTGVWRLMCRSGIVELCGGERHFRRSVDEALRMSERDNTVDSALNSPRTGTPDIESGSFVTGRSEGFAVQPEHDALGSVTRRPG